MAINTKKLMEKAAGASTGLTVAIAFLNVMEKAAGASTGLTVAIAFLNVALLVVKLVETVTEEVPKLEKEE